MHFLKNLTLSAALLLSGTALAGPIIAVSSSSNTTALTSGRASGHASGQPLQTRDIVDLAELAQSVYEDVTGIIGDINAHELEAEADWTKSMAAQIMLYYPGRNFVIFHNQGSQYKFWNADHQHYELSLGLGQTKGYEIWTFDDGQFALSGDGGYANWIIGGNFQRSGYYVQWSAQ